MKKFLAFMWVSLIICMAMLSAGSVLASGIDSEATSEVVPEVTTDDNTIYLDDYSQYQALISGMDQQEENRKAYEEKVKEDIEEYESASRTKVYKAKVVEAGEKEVDYSTYGYYGYYYKTSYQPLKIELLEEPYKGEQIDDFNYILTCDSYENIKLPMVKKGDVINVVVTQMEDGELYAAPASYDAPAVRWQWVIFLMILTIIIMLIYAGKHGAKALIIFVLFADLMIIVGANSVISGVNIAFLIAVISMLTALVYAVLKLGNRAEAYVAILSSLIVTFVIALLILGFDSISKLCGITYEATYLMEYIMPRLTSTGEIVQTVDFHAFSIGITSLVAFAVSIVVSCEVVKVYEKNKNSRNALQDTADEIKEYLADKMMLVGMILLVLIVPKYLILLANKYSFAEIINSEILISEISRALFAVIAIALTAPITALLSRFVAEGEE